MTEERIAREKARRIGQEYPLLLESNRETVDKDGGVLALDKMLRSVTRDHTG